MEKRDTFPFGATARRLVDETDAGSSAASKSVVEVMYRKTDVMNPGAALGDELANRRVRGVGFE